MNSGDPSFGERMAKLRAEGKIGAPTNAGRKPIAEKYRTQIAATEKAFARSMPREAQRFIDELAPREPEQCPTHHKTLCCPDCDYASHRRNYNHTAAQYVFDRVMGRPTSRSENSITIKLVEQLTISVVEIFSEVNAIDDPSLRQSTFAERLIELSAAYGGGAA